MRFHVDDGLLFARSHREVQQPCRGELSAPSRRRLRRARPELPLADPLSAANLEVAYQGAPSRSSNGSSVCAPTDSAERASIASGPAPIALPGLRRTWTGDCRQDWEVRGVEYHQTRRQRDLPGVTFVYRSLQFVGTVCQLIDYRERIGLIDAWRVEACADLTGIRYLLA